jgi:hypothetical protein
VRLVTWNCNRGSITKKLPLLECLRPTIAVVLECSRPTVATSNALWCGDSARLGLAVVAAPEFRLSLVSTRDVPRFAWPVQVDGPISFFLLAVWSKTDFNFRYVKAVHPCSGLL